MWWYTVKAMPYDMLLISDFIADIEQCGRIWHHVGGL